MDYQDQQHSTPGSNPRSEQQSNSQEVPTSTGGNTNPQNGLSDDAPTRLKDEAKEQAEPQINKQGEFKNETGWTRTEGLSTEERRNAEEEDLNGRHSGDSSVI